MSNRHKVVDLRISGASVLLEFDVPDDLTDSMEVSRIPSVLEAYVRKELSELHNRWTRSRTVLTFPQWLSFHGFAEIVQPIAIEINPPPVINTLVEGKPT